MSYIGRGNDAISNVEKLDNITFNGGTTYALTKSSAAFTPVGANNLLISIDGVIQQGNFSVSTTNVVFDFSPTSSNTNNFILHYGTGVLNVPADGAVSTAKLAADSVTGAKIADDQINSEHYVDGSIDTAHIADDQVTLAKMAGLARGKIIYGDASGNPAALTVGSNTQVLKSDGTDISWGADAGFDVSTITGATALTATPATTDELILSDAGTLKRMDFNEIYARPAFAASLTSSYPTLTTQTSTLVPFNTENMDSDSAYDNTAGNYKFVVPANQGGKYQICAGISFQGVPQDTQGYLFLYYNGSAKTSVRVTQSYNGNIGMALSLSIILDMNATDYIQIYAQHRAGSNKNLEGHNWFGATKIVGL